MRLPRRMAIAGVKKPFRRRSRNASGRLQRAERLLPVDSPLEFIGRLNADAKELNSTLHSICIRIVILAGAVTHKHLNAREINSATRRVFRIKNSGSEFSRIFCYAAPRERLHGS
jgi:hypothetical protein